MLLQTLAQLNILLMAAPALAGWVVSPVAHPMLAQAAQGIYQPAARQAEPMAQAAGERHAPPTQSRVAVRPSATAVNWDDTTPAPATPAPAAPLVTLFSPFPHATRAP